MWEKGYAHGVQIFLTVFSLFNLCAAGAACNAIANIETMHGRRGWQSRRLYLIAQIACWGLLLLSLWSIGAGWAFQPGGAPLILLPIAWLILAGLVFAIVDFAEDGVFDFGRGPAARSPGT